MLPVEQLAKLYAEGVEEYAKHNKDLNSFYTKDFCASLAYMLSLYCKKKGILYRIVFIMDSKDLPIEPAYSSHVGILVNNNYYDIENVNGIEFSEENRNSILSKYGLSWYAFNGDYDECFDRDYFLHKGDFKSYEEIVDFVIRSER